MAKEVDANGFWLIEGNPVTKEGVFPYSGAQIDFDGSLGLEQNKIYNVLRPAAELTREDVIKSLNGIPFIDDHEMIGDGCTPYDDRPGGGVLFNVRTTDQSGMIVGDFKIFSEELKANIENGKKELSLGYRCRYAPERGVFQGQTYDFVQKDILGNHIALVDKGRMGSSVRVYDHKATVFDSIESINPIQKGADTMTDEEKAKKEAEEKAAAEAKERDEAAKQKALDEEAEAKAKEEEEKKAAEAKDAEEKAAKEKEDAEKAKGEAMDSAIKTAVKMLSERDALAKQVLPLVGAFDSASMTSADEVAAYACGKLKLNAPKGHEKAMLSGFIAGKSASRSVALDAAPTSGKDVALEKYLAGN